MPKFINLPVHLDPIFDAVTKEARENPAFLAQIQKFIDKGNVLEARVEDSGNITCHFRDEVLEAYYAAKGLK